MKKLLGVFTSCLLGCGGSSSPSDLINTYRPATLATKDDAQNWTGTSAPTMYFYSTLLAASATQQDAGCPVITDDGTTLKASGGCTDHEGVKWTGSVTLARTAAAAQTGQYTFSELASEGPVSCADGGTGTGKTTINGTIKLSGTSTDFTYGLDLRLDGSGYSSKTCSSEANTSAWSYTGHATGGSNNGPTTWNGSGKLGSSTDGTVAITTVDEKIDSSVCASEAASGTTTVTSSGNSIVYTYDGASKCDTSSTVLWSLNGAPKGELTGVACTAMPGSTLIAAAALALLLRRRRA